MRQDDDFGTLDTQQHCLTINSPARTDMFNRAVGIRMVQCMTRRHHIVARNRWRWRKRAELANELVPLPEDTVTASAAVST